MDSEALKKELGKGEREEEEEDEEEYDRRRKRSIIRIMCDCFQHAFFLFKESQILLIEHVLQSTSSVKHGILDFRKRGVHSRHGPLLFWRLVIPETAPYLRVPKRPSARESPVSQELGQKG